MIKITKSHFHNSIVTDDSKSDVTLKFRDINFFLKDLGELQVAALKKHGAVDRTELMKVSILDTETTGLEKDDEVIELSIFDVYLLKSDYSFYSHGIISDELREPIADHKKALSPIIVELTGLTDEMIKGQSIDLESAKQRLLDSDLIIAHNVRFDRNKIGDLLGREIVDAKIFGCSFEGIPWRDLGFMNAKQENLLLYHGVIFDGHRANADVAAITWLMAKYDYFKYVVQHVKSPKIAVFALKSDFSTKDTLSQKFGFSWNAPGKYWYKIMTVADFEVIKGEFESLIYTNMKMIPKYEILQIPAKKLFLQKEDLQEYFDSKEAIKLSIGYDKVGDFLKLTLPATESQE